MKINGKYILKEINEYLLVLFIILSCGTQFFWNYHCAQTLFILVLLTIVYFIRNNRIFKGNLNIVLFIMSILIVVSIFHFDIAEVNGVYILLAKLLVLLVISSNIIKEDFFDKYITIMLIELAISIVCFVVCSVGMERLLPGYYEQVMNYTYKGNSGYNIIYLTPYYTIGWLSTAGFFGRNAGCFSEPGIHAIMLNLALLFFITSKKYVNLKSKKRIIIVVVIAIGVLTTKSTGGVLELIIILFYAIAKKKLTTKNLKRDIIILSLLGIVVALVIQYGSVFDKLVTKSGSFVTRSNDTLGGIQIAIEHFFIGCGFFTNLSLILEKYSIFNISNGFVEMLIRLGIPLTIIILYFFMRGVKRFFAAKGISCILLYIFFILAINIEPIFWNINILLFMFHWKENSRSSRVAQR